MVSWQEKITEPQEVKVLTALADPEWDFRTVSGIARATSIPEDEIQKILEKYPDFIRKSPIPDVKGRDLFTLRSRPIGPKEHAAMMRAFLAKTVH
jgi:hypothetical protein